MEKIIRIHRHAWCKGLPFKGANGNEKMLGQEDHLECSRLSGLFPKPTDVFHSPLIRSSVTASSLLPIGTDISQIKVHDPIEALGSNPLFDEMVAGEYQGKDYKKLSTEVGPRKAIRLLWNSYSNHVDTLRTEVRKMFNVMQGDYALAVGHTPTVEMIMEAFGYQDIPVNFPELSFVQLTQYEDSAIAITWVWLYNTDEINRAISNGQSL